MKHQHSHVRPLFRRPIMLICMLLCSVLASGSMHAQNPLYRFATQLGGSANDLGRTIAVDGSGNIYAAGYFNGTIDFDPGAGTASLTASDTSDIYVAKYDASGNYLWAFHIGGTGDNFAIGNDCYAIAVDGSGNVYITGVFIGTADFDPGPGTANLTQSGTATRYDMYVARYTTSGTYSWAFKVPSAAGHSIAVDGNGNAVVVGEFYASADFNPGGGSAVLKPTRPKGSSTANPDGFVARYSAAGAYLWAFPITGAGYEYCVSTALDPSGNIYVTGNFDGTAGFNPANTRTTLTSAGSSDIFVAKYSSAGSHLWAFRLGSTAHEGGKAIAVDRNANLYLTGELRAAVDFDPGAGNATLTPGGATDIYLAKYTTSGSHIWSLKAGGNSSADDARPNALALDESGNPHLTGFLRGTADFDPGSGSNLVTGGTAATGSVAFVAKYTSAGAHRWAFAFEGIPSSAGNAIAVDGNGNVDVTGSFRNSPDFDPDSTMASRTSAGGHDIFVASYREPTLPKRSNGRMTSSEIGLRVAPNPFTGSFTLNGNTLSAPARIELIDMMGRVVETIEETSPGGTFQLGEQVPAGTYMLRVRQGDATAEMIVQKGR